MAVAHKSYISFGLVHIPVGMYTAIQDNDVSFNQLHKENKLIYKGHVTRGVSNQDFKAISACDRLPVCPFNPFPKGNEEAIWTAPKLVCIVQWMPRQNGAINQPKFKGLRDDKLPKACIDMN
jgi:ATP-dependent DNA ligase